MTNTEYRRAVRESVLARLREVGPLSALQIGAHFRGFSTHGFQALSHEDAVYLADCALKELARRCLVKPIPKPYDIDAPPAIFYEVIGAVESLSRIE